MMVIVMAIILVMVMYYSNRDGYGDHNGNGNRDPPRF